MYLVWINPPINFTFSDDSVFLKKILAGDINSLNFLVWLLFNIPVNNYSVILGQNHCFLGIEQCFGELKVSSSRRVFQ